MIKVSIYIGQNILHYQFNLSKEAFLNNVDMALQLGQCIVLEDVKGNTVIFSPLHSLVEVTEVEK